MRLSLQRASTETHLSIDSELSWFVQNDFCDSLLLRKSLEQDQSANICPGCLTICACLWCRPVWLHQNRICGLNLFLVAGAVHPGRLGKRMNPGFWIMLAWRRPVLAAKKTEMCYLTNCACSLCSPAVKDGEVWGEKIPDGMLNEIEKEMLEYQKSLKWVIESDAHNCCV